MASLHLLSPLFLTSPPPRLTLFSSTSTTLLSTPISRSLHISSNRINRGKTIVFGGNPSESEAHESRFFDKNGVVEDMDGYLNYLSLEYDSVWDTKPSWCQPWTITLTGVSVVACSWFILRSAIVTAIASFLICIWWYIFLYSYPKAYSDMIAERRKRVSSGVEDTYGFEEEPMI